MTNEEKIQKLKEFNSYLFGETNHPLYDDINKTIDHYHGVMEHPEAMEILGHMIVLLNAVDPDYIGDDDD